MFNVALLLIIIHGASEYFTRTKDDDDAHGLTFDVSLKHYLMYFFLGVIILHKQIESFNVCEHNINFE